jgi:hypothetical protein
LHDTRLVYALAAGPAGDLAAKKALAAPPPANPVLAAKIILLNLWPLVKYTYVNLIILPIKKDLYADSA